MKTASRRKDPSALADEFNAIDPPSAQAATRPWRWVPIRSLAPRHRERITRHLLQLPAQDLHLRFGYAASSVQVTRYVDMLDFERDEVFGIFNRHLALIALAHLAYAPTTKTGAGPAAAEFGVSVLPGARGRGYGTHLFDHAMLHARNRGVDTLMIQALSRNEAMLRIAARAGARVERHDGESEAWLKLPLDSVVSHWEQAVAGQAAELNYRLKSHAKDFKALLGSTFNLPTALGKTPDDASGGND